MERIIVSRPKFQVGDKVERRSKIFTVIEVRDAQASIAGSYVYRLNDGHQWYHAESLLTSKIRCPNCGSEGYNHLTGCDFCSISPEDFY